MLVGNKTRSRNGLTLAMEASEVDKGNSNAPLQLEVEDKGEIKGFSVEADARLLSLLTENLTKIGTTRIQTLWILRGVWGPECNRVLNELKIDPPTVLRMEGTIYREEDLVCLTEAIDWPLEKLALPNCVVGISGLKAIVTLTERCVSLKDVDLFNVGPWSMGESLGCCTQDSDEAGVLLLQLYSTLRSRGGKVSNEAFMEDCRGGGALLQRVSMLEEEQDHE